MSLKHLSDDDIQKYLDGNRSDIKISDHIRNCDSCSESVQMYELLYGSLTVQEDVSLSPEFVSSTMQIIRDDASFNESAAATYVYSIGGAIIALVAFGYFVGYASVLKYLGITSMVSYFASFGLFEDMISLVSTNTSLWSTLGFAAVIILFFALVERVLERSKFGKLHTFSI